MGFWKKLLGRKKNQETQSATRVAGNPSEAGEPAWKRIKNIHDTLNPTPPLRVNSVATFWPNRNVSVTTAHVTEALRNSGFQYEEKPDEPNHFSYRIPQYRAWVSGILNPDGTVYAVCVNAFIGARGDVFDLISKPLEAAKMHLSEIRTL